MWLQYQIKTGYVVKIHEEKPQSVPEGFSIIESNDLVPGDEFTYNIIVHEHGISAIQHAPQATHILQKLAKLESDIEELRHKLSPI